jgi:hypothetical protein
MTSPSFNAFLLDVSGTESYQPIGHVKLAGVDLQTLPDREFALVVQGTETVKMFPTTTLNDIKLSSVELRRLTEKGLLHGSVSTKVAEVLLRRAKGDTSAETVFYYWGTHRADPPPPVAQVKTSSASLQVPTDAVGAIKLSGAPNHPMVYRDIRDLAEIARWADLNMEKLSGADMRTVGKAVVDQLGEWGVLDGPSTTGQFPSWIFTLGGNKVSSVAVDVLKDRFAERKRSVPNLSPDHERVYHKMAAALGAYAKARRWDEVAETANILEELEVSHFGDFGHKRVHQDVYRPVDPRAKMSEALFDPSDEKFVDGDTIIRASDIEKLRFVDMSPLKDLLGDEAIEALQSDEAVDVFKSLPAPTKRSVMHFVEQTVRKIGDGAVLNRVLVSDGVIEQAMADKEDDDYEDDDYEDDDYEDEDYEDEEDEEDEEE